MSKEVYHPNAYIAGLRNVRLGLRARTKILNTLEKTTGDAKAVAVQAGLTYAVAMHHLKLLRKSGVVQRRENKPHVWASTGLGQKRLVATS
jgi:predicted transcriptional regulator